MNAKEPKSYRVELSKLSVNVFEWEGEGEPLLLVHATGFHARCWDQVINRLGNRKIYAVETRGHGRSDNFEPPEEWATFGDDLVELVEKLDLKNVTAVGHSMGGHLLVHAAALLPERFKQLLIIDPVIISLERLAARPNWDGDHPAARRRNQWASADEMYEAFKDREPFSGWDKTVLKDYCDFGLLPSEEGDWLELACPPNIEGAIYLSSGGEKIHSKLSQVKCPVRILRARERTADDSPFDFRPSPTWPELVDQFESGSERYLPTHTHFIPMEDPGLVADEIKQLLD